MARTHDDDFKPLTIRQNPEDKFTGQVLASAIREIATAMRSLRSQLTDDAVAILVTNAIPKSYGISEKSVRAVLLGIDSLEKKYVKGGRP
jgi:hypothetical protein